MLEQNPAPPPAVVPRPWGPALLLAALVVLRSVVFVFWPQSHFDSDQAVTGLMAKHLSELRAFPVFWYGQSYMLAVEAWLAAPLMALIGASVTALKLPLLAINVGIAQLLFRGLTRDARLPPWPAAFAVLFFALAAPITSAHLLMANGGNVEPLLYVLLLWFARGSGPWLGLVLGVGFLNREFTIYGAIALVLLSTVRREIFTMAVIRRYAVMLAVATVVWFGVQVAKHYSSAAGPGTSVADLDTQMPGNNLAELVHRFCLDPRALAHGVAGMVTTHYPELFGTEREPLVDFGIESRGAQGAAGASWLLGAVVLIAAATLGVAAVRRQADAGRFLFCVYLLLVSLLSSAGYLLGRCGEVALYTMRYELLSVLGLTALAAWFLGVARARALRLAWTIAAAALLAVSARAHASLLREYMTRPPVAAKQELIDALEARHVRYAYADFWVAYYVTFMTREHIIVAANDAVRIRTYNREVEQHPDAALISRTRCATGAQVTPAFWLCAQR